MPGLGGASAPRENVCRCDHESNQVETLSTDKLCVNVDRDGQAPVPRVRVFPMLSLLRSELNLFLLFRLSAGRL